MRFGLILQLLLLCFSISSQTFTEVQHFNDFAGLGDGPVEFADLNKDGHLDFVTAGKVSKVFLGSEEGLFTNLGEQPFMELRLSAMSVGDLTGDGYPDVLISGMGKQEESITKLYENDGTGRFSEVVDVPFEPVQFSDMVIADFNNDSFADVFIIGRGNDGRVAKLYLSDSTAQLKEVPDTPFPAVDMGALKAADINLDGYLDIVLTGDTGLLYSTKVSVKDSARITKIFLNDGLGTFQELKGTKFLGVTDSSVDVADVTGDSIPDLILTGMSYFFPLVTKLYQQDSLGNFTEIQDSTFMGIVKGEAIFSDINADGHTDVLLAGNKDWKTGYTGIYVNDGSGNFEELHDHPFPGLQRTYPKIADLNSDGLPDVLIAGLAGFRRFKLFMSDSIMSWKETQELPFENMSYGDIALDDYNGDGKKNLFMIGQNGHHALKANFHFGNEKRMFNDTSVVGLMNSSIASADLNDDGHLDLLTIGSDRKGKPQTYLYFNDGSGNFERDTLNEFVGVAKGNVEIVDLDGDGNLDIFYAGEDNKFNPYVKFYMGDGQGKFMEKIDSSIAVLKKTAFEIADLNGDGHKDILITGSDKSFKYAAHLYLNDGAGNFTEVVDAPFAGVAMADMVIADFNGDDYPDVLIAGSKSFSVSKANLYLNDGQGNFTVVDDAPFIGTHRCSIATADMDDDGDLDVLITGTTRVNIPLTWYYVNDGTGHFELVENTIFAGVSSGKIVAEDMNEDGLPDVLISGYDGREYVTRWYINE